MQQEGRAKRRGWLPPLLIGAVGLAAGVVIGGARAIKEIEVATEWPIDAPEEAVFEALLEPGNYADWWPECAGRTNTGLELMGKATVAQCVVPLPFSPLPFMPALHVTVRFPQIDRNLRIRARLTGQVAGIAEWVMVPQHEGVVLKLNARVRLAHPLMNLAALALPEKTWRAHLEGMLLEMRAGLRRAVEATEAVPALSRK
ncbi:MAG TPA: hypothetical protein VH590_06290 [Ktedonobacterales bacterium]|jgi:carbon monoxide dehydrogenase subunit G